MCETEKLCLNKGIQKQLLQLINQMRHWSTIQDATVSLKGSAWSQVMNNSLPLRQNDKRQNEPTGIPGESRGECLCQGTGDAVVVSNQDRCLRNIAKWAAVLDSPAWWQGDTPERSNQSGKLRTSRGMSTSSGNALAKQTILLSSASHDCLFPPFDKNSPNLATNNKCQLLVDLLQSGLRTLFVWLGSGLKKNQNKTAITYNIRKLNLSKS